MSHLKPNPKQHEKTQSVIIAGGGIAGLAAAIALANQGFDIHIFEKAPILSEQGAGVQLGPNATYILCQWGLKEALLARACCPESIELHDAIRGQHLTDLPVGSFARKHWLAPYVTIHRGDLQNILKQAVDKHPLIELHCGAQVRNVAGSLGNGFCVEVITQAGKKEYHGALLLACDGVWSSLRGKDKAKFSGSIAWRTMITRQQGHSLLTNQNIRVFMGENGHLIIYPIQDGRSANLVAITNSASPEHNNKAELFHTFANWKMPIKDIIVTLADWTYWPLFTMTPPCFLSPNGIVFLGDSAHASTPFAAQGAAMALEDAATLANFLPNLASISRQNLEFFAKKRRQRVMKVAKRAAFNRFVYHAGGVVAMARNLAMRSRQPEKFLTDLDWLYTHKI